MLKVKQMNCGRLQASNISIGKGKIAALSGPSGSGKSVFLKALADLIPWKGQVELDGVSSLVVPAFRWRELVTYVSANTVWWSDKVASHMYSHPKMEEWLSGLGLEFDILYQEPTKLSTGQQQRLALLRALCRNPRVVLLDEPTSNLDSDNVIRVEKLISQWVFNNRTVVFTSHDKSQVARFSDLQWYIDGKQVREIQ